LELDDRLVSPNLAIQQFGVGHKLAAPVLFFQHLLDYHEVEKAVELDGQTYRVLVAL